MRFALLVFLMLLLNKGLPGQKVIQAKAGVVPEEARFLAEPNELIREDVALVEALLDMVEAFTADSLVEKRRQYLPGLVGRIARLGARYWERMDEHKRKYVGTMSRSYKIFDGYKDEVDMNIFLIPHLPEYVAMVREGFDRAFARGRKEKHYRYDQPPYPCPEELKWKDLGYLTVECEGTPPGAYRKALDSLFIPTGEGKHPLQNHANFGVEFPSVGMYGTWCMDCNHNCRPEIHPFEWLWWLDFSPATAGSPNQKTWMVGLLRDGSGRFEDWSPTPRNGELMLPVVVPTDARKIKIRIEPLVTGPNAEGLRQLQRMADHSATQTSESATEVLALPNGKKIEVKISMDKYLANLAFSTLNWRVDAEKGLVMGYLGMDVSVTDLYTCRVVVDYAL